MNEISIKASKLMKLLKAETEKEEIAWDNSFTISPKEIKEPDAVNASSCMSEYNFLCRYKGIYFRIAMEHMTEFKSEEELFKHLGLTEDENDPGDMAEAAPKDKRSEKDAARRRSVHEQSHIKLGLMCRIEKWMDELEAAETPTN